MSPRAWFYGLALSVPFWAAIWFATTDTAARMWTAFAASWWLWVGFPAVLVVVYYAVRNSTGVHDYPQRNPGDDLAEYHDLDAVAHCGHSNGALVCDRAPGHEGPHVDSRSGLTHPVRWIDGELGLRSLDDIRRDYGRGRPTDAA